MKTALKIIFLVVLLPIIILWKILGLVVPELTRPFESLADGLRDVFRFN